MPAPWPETVEESEAKRPRVSEDDGLNRECRRSIQSAGGICWSSSDLALAAKLLETPNARFPTITFSNIEEKRRVFTLVYDVLRYKSVLNQALNDVYFFTRYAYLKDRCHLVWLLFLDLYKRDFTLRDPLDPEVEAAFMAQGLFEIDEVLWQLRVKLAATVSRLRIKSGAHSLSHLLPRHLQVTQSALDENIISGWVNIFKTSLKDTCSYLENYGFVALPRGRESLDPLTYKTDHLLPRFLHMMPNAREDLVDSPLVQDHLIIMQERTFCLGPAVMAQLLKNFALSGKVAQTHVNSPITMAYFANLLINNDKIEKLLVFGAGYRKEACEQYLQELGVKNTLVFSENFATLSPESRVLDNVIAVLATPPNTNSSVVDPVDLAVARGGDLQILQQLTDDDFASTPRGDNINKFLRDQRDTLRRGMSKPQIQFVVYETHSRFHCENEEMATNLVNDLNNYAREVHLEELRRAQGETQEKERSQTDTGDSPADVPAVRVEEELALPLPSPVQTVQIPPSDLFEIAELPDLCPNLDNCLDLESEGTYIAVIKRKEITRLDPKYMIQMAEARGLFGRPDATPKAKTPGQTARAKAALAALQTRSDSFEKSKTKVKVEMDRIAAPTRASLLRDVHPPPTKDCPRYTHHLAHDGTPSYMYPEQTVRRSFLTAIEEEELVRRLYTCPRLNLFPPKLYESAVELPALEQPSEITIPGFVHAFIASLSVIIVSEIGDKTFFIAAIMAMKHSRLTVFLGAISALVLMTILSVLFGWLATVIPRNIVYYISTALFAIFGVKMLWEGYHMPPGGAQEEMEEVHADLRKRDDEAGVATTSDAQAEVVVGETQIANEGEVKPSDSEPDPPKIEKEVHMMNMDPESGRRKRQNIVKVVSRIFLQAFTLTFLAEWGDRSQLTTIVLAAREDIYGVMIGGVVGHSLCTGLAVLGGRFVAQRISVRTVTIIGGVVFIIFALSALIFNPLSDEKAS